MTNLTPTGTVSVAVAIITVFERDLSLEYAFTRCGEVCRNDSSGRRDTRMYSSPTRTRHCEGFNESHSVDLDYQSCIEEVKQSCIRFVESFSSILGPLLPPLCSSICPFIYSFIRSTHIREGHASVRHFTKCCHHIDTLRNMWHVTLWACQPRRKQCSMGLFWVPMPLKK